VAAVERYRAKRASQRCDAFGAASASRRRRENAGLGPTWREYAGVLRAGLGSAQELIDADADQERDADVSVQVEERAVELGEVVGADHGVLYDQ
jgi:hypothetical protein